MDKIKSNNNNNNNNNNNITITTPPLTPLTPPTPNIIPIINQNNTTQPTITPSPYYYNNIFNINKKKKSLKNKILNYLIPKSKSFKSSILYRRCCILLGECFLYIIANILFLIFLTSYYPIFICSLISMIVLYIITVSYSNNKFEIISLIYIIIQSILNFTFFLKFSNNFINSINSNNILFQNYIDYLNLIYNFEKHNFLFLINLILSLISIIILFQKFIQSFSIIIILNLINIIIHIVSIYSLNLHKFIIFQNLILPCIISFLLLFYSYILSIDNNEIKEKEIRFKNIFDTSSEALVIHKDGIILDANSTFGRIFQVKQSDLQNTAIWEYLPELETYFQQQKQQQQQQQQQNIVSTTTKTTTTNGGTPPNNVTPRLNYNSSNTIVNSSNNNNNSQYKVSRSNTGFSDGGNSSSIYDDCDSIDFYTNKNKNPIVFDTVGITLCGSEFTAQVKIDGKKEPHSRNNSNTSGSNSRFNSNNISSQQYIQQIQQQIHTKSSKNNNNDYDVISIVDASARKKLIVADQALRRAEELNQAKINLLTTISHEVRTPINGILASVEILDSSQLDPIQRDFLSSIKSAADYLLDLITDILDFSKFEAGKFSIERIEFNILTMLEESLNIVCRTAQERGIDVLTYIDPDIPIILKGDPYRVKQCLLNFLSNAIKFTSKGQIIIRISIVEQKVNNSENGTSGIVDYKLLFSVEDSGVGIKEELVDHLFTPFHQLGDSPRKYLGTGLGLSISKKLTSLMGGDISVKSVYGVGSTFSFTSILQTESLNPITLKSLGNSLSQTLIKLSMMTIPSSSSPIPSPSNSSPPSPIPIHLKSITSTNTTITTTTGIPKINGFIYDDNIHTSNSISKFLNLMDIKLKVINPDIIVPSLDSDQPSIDNQINLKNEITSFFNKLNKPIDECDDDNDNDKHKDDDFHDSDDEEDDIQDDDGDDDDTINIIITSEITNENLLYFKKLMLSFNRHIDIYWFLLTENGLQAMDTSFYSGVVKKPSTFSNLVETIFKVFNCQIPFELYHLLTNGSKDDYKNYGKQRKEPLKKKSIINQHQTLLPLPSSSSNSLSLNQSSKIPPLELNKSNKSHLLRKSPSYYSDHVPITRGMVQVNRSPRPSTPPQLFNLKGSLNNSNNNLNSSGGGGGGNNNNGIILEPLNISEPMESSSLSSPCNSGTPNNNFKINYRSISSNQFLTTTPSSANASPSIFNTPPPPTSVCNFINDQISLNQSLSPQPPQPQPPIPSSIFIKTSPTIKPNFIPPINIQSSSFKNLNNLNNDNQQDAHCILDINESSNNNNNNQNQQQQNQFLEIPNQNYDSINNTPPISPHKRHALIADDNDLNRKVLAQLLKKMDWTASFAKDGSEAIKQITSERCFDLVFMDCQMPIVDGFDATKSIRKIEIENNWKRINIVALSTDSSSSFGQICMDCGMDSYVGKPISETTLKDALSKFGGYRD